MEFLENEMKWFTITLGEHFLQKCGTKMQTYVTHWRFVPQTSLNFFWLFPSSMLCNSMGKFAWRILGVLWGNFKPCSKALEFGRM
jgi:hypothetical protein